MNQDASQKILKRSSLSLKKKSSQSSPSSKTFSNASSSSKQHQTTQSTNNSDNSNLVPVKSVIQPAAGQSDMAVDSEDRQDDTPLFDESLDDLSVGNTTLTEEETVYQVKAERSQTDDMDEDFAEETTSLNKTFTSGASSSNSTTVALTTEPSPRIKMAGEDVFTEACVKTWQSSRIKAWESRYLSPETYYYRFVTPGEGQQMGAWSPKEHKLFMDRYEEWISNGWKIGASWGLFSTSIPHRVGYQCMNYYRKLVEKKKLEDPSYELVDGKLKQTKRQDAPGNDSNIPTSELGPDWEREDVKQLEKNVDSWLKQYHKRSGCASTAPVRKPKSILKPKAPKSTTSSRSNKISSLIEKQRSRKRPLVLDDEVDFIMETAEPETVHMKAVDDYHWKLCLEEYKAFVRDHSSKDARHQAWIERQEWHLGLTTTEMQLNKITPAMEQLAKSLATTKSIHQQASLSRFFTGVKKAKVEIPDELILYTRLPPELYSGVKHITPLSDNDNNNNNNDVDRRIYYREIDDMMDCVELLNNELEGEDMDVEKHSQIEGLLVDPPWEYIIEDGRNDGLCKWNLNQVSDLLEKVLERMSAGLIFMWTHKLIQGDVIRMMSDLGCKYVENLVWFKKSINNLPMNEPYPYFSSTKEILLMFKKGDGIDLRHQRSPDVIIDFEQPPSQWIHEEYTEPKPSAVFTMIETLLPQGAYNDKIKRGRFVELWAKRSDTRRQGWFAFHQRKDVNANLLEEMSLDDTLTQPCQNTTS